MGSEMCIRDRNKKQDDEKRGFIFPYFKRHKTSFITVYRQYSAEYVAGLEINSNVLSERRFVLSYWKITESMILCERKYTKMETMEWLFRIKS